MSLIDYIITSIAFAFFVVCPRMAGMCSVVSKIRSLNPYIVSCLGTVISTPLIILMMYLTTQFGITSAIILAVLTDIISSIIMGIFNIKYAIEIVIIAIFVWIGVVVASKTSTMIVNIIKKML